MNAKPEVGLPKEELNYNVIVMIYHQHAETSFFKSIFSIFKGVYVHLKFFFRVLTKNTLEVC